MTVREFTDAHGASWQVWEVIPGSQRVSGPPTGKTPNVWGSGLHPDAQHHTQADYDAGWLVFLHGTERRRFAPIPPQWAEFDDARLLGLLDHASRAAPE